MTTLHKLLIAAALVALAGAGLLSWKRNASTSAATQTPSSRAAMARKPRGWETRDIGGGSSRDAALNAENVRRQGLARLTAQWNQIGGKNSMTREQNALAVETVRQLGCGPETYELVQLLEERTHLYGVAKIDQELARLFRSADATGARSMLATIPEMSVKGKRFAKLEEWSKLAGKGCPAEDFDDFLALLQNEGCALEARFGRNETLMRSDPEAAILSTLQALESDIQSRTKAESLKLLFWEDLPEDVDFVKLEAMLPPDDDSEAVPDAARRGMTGERNPIVEGRQELYRTWAKTDPKAAANHLLRDPDNLNQAALRAVAERFAADTPADCLAWLRELPEGLVYDTAASAAVTYIRMSLLEEARALSIKIVDPEQRKSALETVDRPFHNEGTR